MKIADTISVNPGKDTLGHAENPASSVFRSHIIGANGSAIHTEFYKVLFPSVGAGLGEYRKYDVPLRTIFATILIVTGISLLTIPFGIHSVGFAVTTLAFGGLLALGLFTRPVMLGAAVFYCVCGALSLRAGTPDLTVFSLMFGTLIFGIIGAGKYSCDTLIRQAIRRHNARRQQKLRSQRLSYKAFHTA